MYTIDDLKKHKYFNGADINFVLDSLTGVISRQYILDYARFLVEHNTPFAMCMMDLDNFKYVNDSYGHNAGDKCLQIVAENLQRCTGDDGLVGRFGGDEFIILYLKSNKYDDVHDFFARLYDTGGAVRRSIYLDKVRVFITATIGSASFPLDAETYDDLFKKMDKALYRGKSKGRNCYIVYVHEKHKDIVVNDRGTNSLLHKTFELKDIIDTNQKDELIPNVINYLFRSLHPKDIVFVNTTNDVRSAAQEKNINIGNNMYFILDRIVGDKKILPCSNPNDIKSRFPETDMIITKNKIHAFVAARVKDVGFIILYENAVTRMWQDYDLVLINFAATLLEYELNK
ncbi:MAG: GGDEF domain-containing protein [Acholeplasmatales bacterium]|nr:GGDEF domain-containing protein [Acholeplasmatales bacterium]